MATINVQDKIVGSNQPCFIVAEAGINHNGRLEIAKKLIDAAVQAGVDAIKFQILTAKGLYVENAGKFTTDWGEEHDIYEIWKKTEMPDFWIPELANYCKQKKVLFFSSVFDEETVDLLDPHVGIYKIASSETTHIPLLIKAANTGKPVIFSIGGGRVDEVDEAVQAIQTKDISSNNIGILYCVTKYPTPFELANVRAINTLQEKYPRAVIGYSDHSLDPCTIPVAAVAAGAKIIEKHFTLSRQMEGIDHKMSLEPHELKQMVEGIREAERKMHNNEEVPINPVLLGEGKIKLTKDLTDMMKFVRRTIFATKDIKQGETFNPENISVLRPGNRNTHGSLHPREYTKLLESKATRGIQKLSLITEDCINEE